MYDKNLKAFYKALPGDKECVAFLEATFWDNGPMCPYCNSPNPTPMPKEMRYHCNTCKTTFSVTAQTILHKTKIDLQKWFYVIWLIGNGDANITARELGKRLNVTKDTAWLMLNKIKSATAEGKEELKKISETLNSII